MLPNASEPAQWSAHPNCSGTRRRLRGARGALARPCETSQLVTEVRFVFALRNHRGNERRVAQPLELLTRDQRAGVSAPKRSRRSRRA